MPFGYNKVYSLYKLFYIKCNIYSVSLNSSAPLNSIPGSFGEEWDTEIRA